VRYAAGDSEKPNQVPRGGGVRSQPTGYGGSWLRSGWAAGQPLSRRRSRRWTAIY